MFKRLNKVLFATTDFYGFEPSRTLHATAGAYDYIFTIFWTAGVYNPRLAVAGFAIQSLSFVIRA